MSAPQVVKLTQLVWHIEGVGARGAAGNPAVFLRVGTPAGRNTVDLDQATTQAAWQEFVTQLVTTEHVEEALAGTAVESAARAVVDASIEGHTRIDELVSNLNVLSKGAQTLAFVRQTPPAFNMLVDPVEVADQAYAGSGEFMLGWWQIRTSRAEPARQRVELLEGRFPRARQR